MPLPGHLTGERVLLEAVARRESKAVFVGDDTLLCRVLGSYFMYADADDVGIAPHFALNGYWEAEVTLALARAVRPGSWCLDVGANHGYYTLVLAAGCAPGGHVAAVEPNPRSVDLMARTMDVNGFLEHVDIVPRAVSDRAGEEVRFFIPRHRGMNALVAEGGEATGTTIDTETETIDRLTEKWPRVDLAKIDVEGSEEAVWRGMQRVVAENPDITIILEVNAARYENAFAFLEEIEGAGFEIRYIGLNGDAQHVEKREIASTSRDWMLFLRRDPAPLAPRQAP
jgi:FkbM family methyltransferase